MGSISAILVFLQSPSRGLQGTNFLASDQDDAQYEQAFSRFISRYHKNYLTHEEYEARFKLFKKNLMYIMQHNNTDYKLALNTYADWSDAEREQILQSNIPEPEDDWMLRDYP